MLIIDEGTKEKMENALNKSGPVRILLEKNLKGTVTLEITEKTLLEQNHA